MSSPGRVGSPKRVGSTSVTSHTATTGAPIISESLSWFDYTMEDILPRR